MSDHPTPADMSNKYQREAAYWEEMADMLAETLEMISLTTMSTFASPTHMAETHKAWAQDALATYNAARLA